MFTYPSMLHYAPKVCIFVNLCFGALQESSDALRACRSRLISGSTLNIPDYCTSHVFSLPIKLYVIYVFPFRCLM